MASKARFEPYLQILSSLVPGARQTAIYGIDGEVLDCAPAAPSPGLQACAESVLAQLARHNSGRFADARLLVDGAATYVFVVRGAADKPLGLLILQCAPAALLADTADVESLRLLAGAALSLLEREFTTVAGAGTDLENEASIHLQWAADVALNQTADTHGGIINDTMLRSLLQRSNARAGLLYLPACGLEVMIAPPEADTQAIEQLRRVTVQHIFPVISKSGLPMTANKIRESSNAELVPYRILCVPLTRGSITVGLIAVYNPRSASSFTPHDENLLQCLASSLIKLVESAYDEATGLLTRQAFEENAVRRLEHDAPRSRCVVYGDMDRLHTVNDLFGFARGDEILRTVANVWHRSALPKGSLVSRLSGDRFVGMLDGVTLNQARAWAEKLRNDISAILPPAECAGLNVTASFGIAAMAADQTLNHALAASETACKAAKDRGRNRVELFADTDASLMQRHDDLHVFRDLVDALDAERFQLFAQPLRPLSDPGRATHYEILLRMLDASSSIVMPAKFLSAATRYQLFSRLDQWVITNALASLQPHRERLQARQTTFWINLSGQSLAQPDFADFVRNALHDADLPRGSIGFEITENAAIGNLEQAQRFMRSMRELGCSFALDDFGTGLSSLKYLKDLQVSMLKIDGSFIRDVLRDSRSDSLVRAVLRVAAELDLETTAECIESRDVADHLSALGVTYGQGFELGRPGPLSELLASQFTGDNDATNVLSAAMTAAG